jgi:hypothetical protein
MSTVTPNFGFILPSPNDPTDQDLWGGMLNSNFTLLDTLLEQFPGEMPIGSLYFNADVSTNPGTLLGYGTWSAFGAGRVVIGAGSGTDINGETVAFTAGATGGEYNHTLTVAEMPEHTHTVNTSSASWNNGSATLNAPATPYVAGTSNTSSAGSGDKHNNIQPYVVIYAWRRTA